MIMLPGNVFHENENEMLLNKARGEFCERKGSALPYYKVICLPKERFNPFSPAN